MLAKGHLHGLMGHLALHISAFIGTVEPEKIAPMNHYFCPYNGAVLWRIYTQSGQIPEGRGTFIPK